MSRLDFLKKGVVYDVEMIADSADSGTHPRHYDVNRTVVKNGDRLPLSLVKAGGAVVKIVPRK